MDGDALGVLKALPDAHPSVTRQCTLSASHEPKRASSSFSAADLQKMTLPEPRWIVPGLIPEGVTLLAGKPRVGKSWLALDLAIAVATGAEALGIRCPQAARRLRRTGGQPEPPSWPDGYYTRRSALAPATAL